MRGVLADEHIGGQLQRLEAILAQDGLTEVLAEVGVRFVSFVDLGWPTSLSDRELWHRCQADGWVLLTANRNHDGPDSLGSTLADSWREGLLPVITIADAEKFHRKRSYLLRSVRELATLLFELADGLHRDRPRIYIPQRPDHLPAS